jgi:hypothetical protein
VADGKTGRGDRSAVGKPRALNRRGAEWFSAGAGEAATDIELAVRRIIGHGIHAAIGPRQARIPDLPVGVGDGGIEGERIAGDAQRFEQGRDADRQGSAAPVEDWYGRGLLGVGALAEWPSRGRSRRRRASSRAAETSRVAH